MHQVVPLELLGPNEEGRIVAVDGEPDLVARLAEIGLREGVVVRMVRPGQPCILALAGHRLSFRGEGNATILVEPVEGGPVDGS